MHAIEYGIVQLLRVPVTDSIPDAEGPVLGEPWSHVAAKMPKKGRGNGGVLDPLHLVVEIKGRRGENAKEKANTMRQYWVPAVNNDGQFGRWTVAEFTATLDAAVNVMLEESAPQTAEEAIA